MKKGEKGTFAQHVFITLGKLNEFADFLACRGTYAKKQIDQRFSSGTSKFRSSHNRDNKKQVLGQTTTFRPLLWCASAVNVN